MTVGRVLKVFEYAAAGWSHFYSLSVWLRFQNPNRRTADSAQPPWPVKKLELLLQEVSQRAPVSGMLYVFTHRFSLPKGESVTWACEVTGPAAAASMSIFSGMQGRTWVCYIKISLINKESIWKDSFNRTRLPQASQEGAQHPASCVPNLPVFCLWCALSSSVWVWKCFFLFCNLRHIVNSLHLRRDPVNKSWCECYRVIQHPVNKCVH